MLVELEVVYSDVVQMALGWEIFITDGAVDTLCLVFFLDAM